MVVHHLHHLISAYMLWVFVQVYSKVQMCWMFKQKWEGYEGLSIRNAYASGLKQNISTENEIAMICYDQPCVAHNSDSRFDGLEDSLVDLWRPHERHLAGFSVIQPWNGVSSPNCHTTVWNGGNKSQRLWCCMNRGINNVLVVKSIMDLACCTATVQSRIWIGSLKESLRNPVPCHVALPSTELSSFCSGDSWRTDKARQARQLAFNDWQYSDQSRWFE